MHHLASYQENTKTTTVTNQRKIQMAEPLALSTGDRGCQFECAVSLGIWQIQLPYGISGVKPRKVGLVVDSYISSLLAAVFDPVLPTWHARDRAHYKLLHDTYELLQYMYSVWDVILFALFAPHTFEKLGFSPLPTLERRDMVPVIPSINAVTIDLK